MAAGPVPQVAGVPGGDRQAVAVGVGGGEDQVRRAPCLTSEPLPPEIDAVERRAGRVADAQQAAREHDLASYKPSVDESDATVCVPAVRSTVEPLLMVRAGGDRQDVGGGIAGFDDAQPLEHQDRTRPVGGRWR